MRLVDIIENDIIKRFDTEENRVGVKSKLGHRIDILKRFSNSDNWDKSIVVDYLNSHNKLDISTKVLAKTVIGIEEFKKITDRRNI